MTPDRPLFTHDPAEQALLAFYDAVPAAELFDAGEGSLDFSMEDLDEPEVTWAQAIAVLVDQLGAIPLDD